MRCGVRHEAADGLVAAVFVLAAAAEAVLRDRGTPALLVFNAAGAAWLAVLALRRRRPVLTITTLAVGGTLGSLVTATRWPQAPDAAGAWIVGLLLACYSLGAYARGRVAVLGVLLPAVVVVSADLSTRNGWTRISGILFVSLLIGLLPTLVGRLVRERRQRLSELRAQRERILRAQRSQQEAAVLAERLRATERLQPTLAEGLGALADSADADADPGAVETRARELLARTREEVVALSEPVLGAALPAEALPRSDHLATLRAAAQPWSVLAAGGLVAGLVAESKTLEPSHPALVLPAALLVATPLTLTWWRPVAAVTVAWLAVALSSLTLAPLDATLSEAAFALASAFAVAALSRRPAAVAGLLVCAVGQLVGVGADPGAETLLLLAWLGGLAVNEATRLVEQTRANNELLAGQEDAAAGRAVVQERLRLAREVHDAVGHTLTVVALQAGAARRLAMTDPARAREAMRTVGSVARSGATSLLLEEDADLEALVERVRGAGLVLETDVRDARSLAPQVRQVVFRVVQEALTNVLRHAPGSAATVTVRRSDATADLDVVVTNTPSRAPGAGPGTGRGLTGIRDRVAAAGGETRWGPRADGCFEVRVALPVRARTSSPAETAVQVP